MTKINQNRQIPGGEKDGDTMAQSNAQGFFAQVWALVERIPPGRVASYGQLALMLGRPGGARIVGWAMRACPDGVPFQRVVRDDGSIAGGDYAPLRRALLESEGVPMLADGRVDIAHCRWDGR